MASIRELKEELEALDKRREVVKRLLDALVDYEGLTTKSLGVARPSPGAMEVARRIRARRAPVMTATYDLVREMLNELGRPVQTQEIIKRMEEKGMDVPEDNAANVVSARLSNSEEFEGRRGKGWWFANRAWPEEESELL